jgi:hypothetical protein
MKASMYVPNIYAAWQKELLKCGAWHEILKGQPFDRKSRVRRAYLPWISIFNLQIPTKCILMKMVKYQELNSIV